MESNITRATSSRIALQFWDKHEQPTIKRSFRGRWLVGDAEQGSRTGDTSEPWDAGAEWSVAQTSKGEIVVYRTHCNDRWGPALYTYASFEEFASAEDERSSRLFPSDIVAEVEAALSHHCVVDIAS